VIYSSIGSFTKSKKKFTFGVKKAKISFRAQKWNLGPKINMVVWHIHRSRSTWSKKKYTCGGQKSKNSPPEPKNGIRGPKSVWSSDYWNILLGSKRQKKPSESKHRICSSGIRSRVSYGHLWSFWQPWNHGRRQSDGIFFFVKIGFSPIKSHNSSKKSIRKSVLYINFDHRK
jgi:hypothetical protein